MGEPVCHALLMADRVIVENTGKKGLIGVFGRFNFPDFPVVAPQWFIYALITNIAGKHEFSLNLVRDETQAVILPIAGEIDIPNEDAEVELVLPINNLRIPRPGSHTLTLNVDGYPLASRILRIEHRPKPEKKQ